MVCGWCCCLCRTCFWLLCCPLSTLFVLAVLSSAVAVFGRWYSGALSSVTADVFVDEMVDTSVSFLARQCNVEIDHI